jgi:hypothetical protein
MRLLFLLLSIVATVASSPCRADAYTFSLLPADGSINGPAGSTIGWGYSITNNDPVFYLVPTAVNSSSFDNGTPFALFDFPVVAPGATVSENFSPDVSGFYQFTWDASAPNGFTNVGVFQLSAAFYSGDPFGNGQYLFAADDSFAPYSATVTNVGSVPEASTWAMMLVGFAGLGFVVYRRRVAHS